MRRWLLVLMLMLATACTSKAVPENTEVVTKFGLITAKEEVELGQVEQSSKTRTSVYGSVSSGGGIRIGVGFLVGLFDSEQLEEDPIRYDVKLLDGSEIEIYHLSRNFEVDDCVMITLQEGQAIAQRFFVDPRLQVRVQVSLGRPEHAHEVVVQPVRRVRGLRLRVPGQERARIGVEVHGFDRADVAQRLDPVVAPLAVQLHLAALEYPDVATDVCSRGPVTELGPGGGIAEPGVVCVIQQGKDRID